MFRQLSTGDLLEQSRDAAILRFCGKRKVLSTSALNGGLQGELTAVYNHNDCPRGGAFCTMRGSSMAEHQARTAEALGLDAARVTGLHTGANIDNTAIVSAPAGSGVQVTAIVTAGVEVNGCRVGSAATLDERDGAVTPLGGTINILLVVDADLTDGCMARALVTCTEAKVAALQELVVSDCYGRGLATGSGTDGTVIVSNSESPVRLREAGESFRLGEAIGRGVMAGVKEALFRQSGLCAGRQHHVFRRLRRFGVTEDAIWEEYLSRCSAPMARAAFDAMMEEMALDGSIVSLAALYAHLIDETLWELLLPQEATETGARLLALMNAHHAVPETPALHAGGDPGLVADEMARGFCRAAAGWVLASADRTP